MSPADANIIRDKLSRLREVTALIEGILKTSRETFRKDTILNNAAMYNLAIGIEIVIDIGNHILTQEFQKLAQIGRAHV